MKRQPRWELPLVSIVATSYNHEKYIRQCVDSLVNQTYPNVEITIVDDCSTDGSLDILRSYGDRITLVTHKNNLGIAGVCDTLNNFIRSARGQYFYRIDSDDFIELDYIDRMMKEVQADPSLDWVCGGLNVVDADGRLIDRWEYVDWPTDPDQAVTRGWQTCSVLWPHNGLLRTDFLRQNQVYYVNFEYGWGGDVRFTIQGALKNARVKFIVGPGINWRTHGTNNSVNIERRIRLVLAVKEYYIESIPVSLYLKHPLLDQQTPGTPEYSAVRDYLFAAYIYAAKINFRVPPMFIGPETAEGLKQHLSLFDPLIRKYAERSRSASGVCRGEVTALLDRLTADELVVRGRKALEDGNRGEAATCFHDALKVNPACSGALNGLAETSLAAADNQAAEQYITRALKISADDSETLNNAAVMLHMRGDNARAEQALLKALVVNPANTDAHLNLLTLEGVFSLRTPPDKNRRAAVLRSVQWISSVVPDNNREELLTANRRLRDDVLTAFRDCYAGSDERILLHRPGNGALKYLMDSWAEALDVMGIPTRLLNWGELTGVAFEQFSPTVFITVADPAFMQQLDTDYIRKYRSARRLNVGHITTLSHRYEPCDFLVTFHLDPSRDDQLSRMDLPLLSLPFGINPMQHYMRPGREVWDFFFVGTNSHQKVKQTNEFLAPVLQNHEGILAGVGWQNGLGELPVDQAALLYNFATIYPNFHLENNFRAFNEITERAYIIPACGGFELTDSPLAMKELFAPDEMAQADSPARFQDMFEHFLRHPAERLSYIRKGMTKVYTRDTLFHRLDRLAQYLNLKASTKQPASTPQAVP